ncbi:MAG TPA: Hsp20/alpha crystallin family protein [Acidimicrobiales bacterium]|nr:Hsp20/alpha crystallin family protein [Acidimicrobiales bacterium]
MLVRFDPFRDFDRLWESVATPTSPRSFPMNAVRRGDALHVSFDLPGFTADQVDLTVERNQLTLTAERRWEKREGEEWLVAERPAGTFRRQLLLGDNLDTDRLEARFHDGVLEVRIPIAEAAKPRKVTIGTGEGGAEAIEATSSEAA